MLRSKKSVSVPEVGDEAPEFHLPSAQGGQFKLSLRTVRGPVVVVFYRGVWSEEDIEYARALAAREDEINLASASVVAIAAGEPDAAREFLRKSGMKSYVLYDYVRDATREWGLLDRDRERGEFSRPATFIVGADRKIVHAWTGERPKAEEILAKVSEITGLPRPADEDEEGDEKPKKPRRAAGSEASGAESSGKPSPEEREKRRAERRAAREAEASSEGGSDQPKNEKPENESKKPPEDGAADGETGSESEKE